MKSLILAVIMAFVFVACGGKATKPDPIVPVPVVCEAGFHAILGGACVKNDLVCQAPAVLNSDGSACIILPPEANFCSPKGNTVECEAQFSMQPNSTKCQKGDGSDWAPSYFKDIPTLDAWGKAHGFGFRINRGQPGQFNVGADVWPWECGQVK